MKRTIRLTETELSFLIKKIIEEHGGLLRLEDADLFHDATRAGACAVIELPLSRARDQDIQANKDRFTHD